MSKRKWYTIYQAENDELLTIGVEKECSDNLGLSQSGFKSMVTRVKMGKNKKYIIAVEEFDDEDDSIDNDVKIYGESNFGIDWQRKYQFNKNEAMSLYLMGLNDIYIANELDVSVNAIQNWRKGKKLESLVGRGRPSKRRE